MLCYFDRPKSKSRLYETIHPTGFNIVPQVDNHQDLIRADPALYPSAILKIENLVNQLPG